MISLSDIKNFTVRIETLGCKLNQIESESLAKFFSDSGFCVKMNGVTSSSKIDEKTILCILNTCTVTEKSEQKARRIIRLLLKKYPDSALIVTGCYAQLRANEILLIDEKRICVIGGQIKSRLSEIPFLLKNSLFQNEFFPEEFVLKINGFINSKKQEKTGFPENSFKLSSDTFISHSRASLKIQDGCNCNCSYCAIHLARGKSVSLDAKTAVQRVLELENQGHDEIVITAVNAGQYKSEFNGEKVDFSKLLELFLQNTSTVNFRISSIYPDAINENFCKIIKSKRIRPHFHLSVQSGSDKILFLMNRNYDSKTVLNAVKMLRKAKPDSFIACDIIAGFSGETEEDFEKTVELCKNCNFSWIHAFPFSERPDTKACEMKDKVPKNISKKRSEILNEISVFQKTQYIKKFIGKTLYAILENLKIGRESSKNSCEYIYHAVTQNFIHCEIHSNCKLNQFERKTVKVQIEKILEEKIQKGGETEVLAKIIF